MKEVGYSREKALAYAEEWALKRNPAYMNFERLGGDCTNFASQCLFAGCGIMNYAKKLGWYYIDASRRSPSWSGVHFFHEFLTINKGAGPYGVEAGLADLLPGDYIQLSNANRFHHTLIVVDIAAGLPYVAAHTIDSYNRPLDSYVYETMRAIHIKGCRKM